jgi:hypothetical protein
MPSGGGIHAINRAHQKPKRVIKSHVAPLGYMVAPGQWADKGHAEWYRDFPAFVADDECSASR